MEDVDLNTNKVQGDSTKSSTSKAKSSQRISKERLDSSFDKTSKNRQSHIKVNDLIDGEYESYRNQINTEKGYIKKVGETLGSLRTKLPNDLPESEYKTNVNVSSSQDDTGEERLIKYSEEFAADIDKLTQRFESNLKKNFENTAHNILHQHLNNQSLLENDEIYKNRESKYLSQRGSSKYSSHKPKSLRNSGEFSKAPEYHTEYSYISDAQPKKGETPSKREAISSTLPMANNKWDSLTSPKDNSKLSHNVSQVNLFLRVICKIKLGFTNEFI